MKYVIGALAFFSLLYFSKGFAVSLHEKLSNKVMHQAIRRLAVEKNLLCIGTGGGAMGLIQQEYLGFFYYQPIISIDEARRLLLYAAETYRHDINACKELRPYLITYPFPANRVEITIHFFKKKNQERVDIGQIKCASVRQGSVYYYIEKKETDWEPIYQETYQEALDILHKEKIATLEVSHE